MTNRRRIYSVPRGRIVTPFSVPTVPPPSLTPKFSHTSVRAITYQRQRVFSPPFFTATTPGLFVRPAGRPPTLRQARGRISPVFQVIPTAGPGPLVPQFRRTRVLSLRGLRTPHGSIVTPVKPPPPPPPPLPAPPQSSGGIVKDFLHWWRTGAD